MRAPGEVRDRGATERRSARLAHAHECFRGGYGVVAEVPATQAGLPLPAWRRRAAAGHRALPSRGTNPAQPARTSRGVARCSEEASENETVGARRRGGLGPLLAGPARPGRHAMRHRGGGERSIERPPARGRGREGEGGTVARQPGGCRGGGGGGAGVAAPHFAAVRCRCCGGSRATAPPRTAARPGRGGQDEQDFDTLHSGQGVGWRQGQGRRQSANWNGKVAPGNCRGCMEGERMMSDSPYV